MPSIHKSVSKGDWARVRSKLSSKSKAKSLSSEKYDSTGLNAFHLLCSNPHAPPDIVTTLAEIDEENLTARTQNGQESTPLHLACRGGDARTVKTLLRLKSDTAADFSIQRDAAGFTPMDELWHSFFQMKLDQMKTDAAADDTSRRNVLGSIFRELDALTIRSARDLPPDFASMWEKTVSLAFAVTTGKMEFPLPAGQQWFCLHGLVEDLDNVFFLPGYIVAMRIALLLYPLQVRIPDDYGNVPLHIAAMGPYSYQTGGGQRECLSKKKVELSVKILLKVFPAAAERRNHDGRRPLHLAALSSLPWAKAVKPLVEAAPQVIDIRDPKTGLYPFMLAGAGEKSDIDSIYSLLRASPTNVQSGIKLTSYEIWLEKRLTKRESENDELNKRVKKRRVVG